MKRRNHIFIFFITLTLYACNNGYNANLFYETGIYKPFKQDIVSMYVFTEGRTIDENTIKQPPGAPSGNRGDIHFEYFEPADEAITRWDSIHLGENNRAYIHCPICLNTQYHIKVIGDSLFMEPTDLNVIKFSPYSKMGVVAVKDPDEAKRYATLSARMIESGFIITSYDIIVRSSSFKRGVSDSYYLDLHYLKNELRNNDTLIYAKKETYFRKQ